MGVADAVPLPGQALPTFHGKVYVAKKARKTSDLPASMTNANAAQRRIIELDDPRPTTATNTMYALTLVTQVKFTTRV